MSILVVEGRWHIPVWCGAGNAQIRASLDLLGARPRRARHY